MLAIDARKTDLAVQLRAERALSDALAEALRIVCDRDGLDAGAALARYDAARGGTPVAAPRALDGDALLSALEGIVWGLDGARERAVETIAAARGGNNA